jgi:chromosome segregation ATPase
VRRPPGPPLDAAAAQQQLEALQEQVRQLQADKTVLEAKLREALAVQPAAVDPRELARAQQRIRLLEKQTDLLQAGLEQARAQARLDPAALTQAQSALAEANRKLAEETRRANTLAEEKKQLQAKLESLIPSGWNLANIEKTKQALEDANRQLAEQQEIARKLRAEKEALELRAGAPVADASAASALRAENELLKKQLRPQGFVFRSARTRDLRAQLAQAQRCGHAAVRKGNSPPGKSRVAGAGEGAQRLVHARCRRRPGPLHRKRKSAPAGPRTGAG